MIEVQRERPTEPTCESPLVFLHIPKTAGTTLEGILRHHYGESLVTVKTRGARDAGEVRRRMARALQGGTPSVIKGHFTFGACDVLPLQARYVTVLREPVERMLSHYHHTVATRGRWRPRRLQPLPPGLTLTEALARGYLPDNLQTRMLCGIVSPWDALPADALERAKQNLARLDFVGTTARFDELVAILNLRFGWPTVAYAAARVSSGRRTADELQAVERETVEQANALDRELYSFAEQVAAERIDHAGLEVRQELGVLVQAADRVRSRRAPRLRALPQETRVELALKEAQISRARADTRKIARRERQLRDQLGLQVGARARRDAYPALVFFHLPKTAGTTLESLMRYLYDDSFASIRTQDALEPDELRERVQATLANGPFRAVKGHLTMGVRDLLPDDARYATVLRDPVERTLSHFGHVLRGARWRPRRLPPPPAGLTVAQAVEQRYIPDDLQTRMLCGIVSPWDELPDDALERAKEHLAGFELVGTTERFDDFVALLNVALGWPTVAFTSGHVGSQRPRREQLTAEDSAVVENANLLDRALYDHAAARFEQACKRMGAELERELEVLTVALDRRLRGAVVPLRSLLPETRVELALKERELGRVRADARKHARGEAWAQEKLALLRND
jgi:sulfotransferase famil protein